MVFNMKLQNILFPTTEICTEEEMYFRRIGTAKFLWGTAGIKLHKGASIHFDTYFNSFSVEKWFKYTNIYDIKLTLKIKGNVRIELYRKEKVGLNIEQEYVQETICQTEEISEITLNFATISQNGIYAFSIIGEKGTSEFFGGYYSADISSTKVRKIKLAINICTFNREKIVEKNLQLLKSRSELFNSVEVFITDNAGTLDTDKLDAEKIHVYRNKNVGGTGGFTRGLMEINTIREEKGITHVLLMDDDVIIDPEVIFRTINILSCVKEQYYEAFLGGAMLRLDQRNIQIESGALWNGGDICSLKNGLDLIDVAACLFNEFEEQPQFNAWWYCVFPLDIVTDTNLPVPIFIRGDDVEYGLRNMKYLILMNGICVWHEPFEKKYSSFLFYYILRNKLIVNSLHGIAMKRQQLIKLLEKQVMEQVRLYRYKNANLLMEGVEDFLKGVKWLANQDGEDLHKKVVNSGYKLQYLEELEETVHFSYPMYEDSISAKNPTTFKYYILHKCTINGILLLPSSKARLFNIVPVEGVKDISVYRTDKVLNYDYNSRKGFLTYKNPCEAKKTIGRFKKICKKIRSEYDKAVRDYAINGKTLMTREFWEKYLQLNEIS